MTQESPKPTPKLYRKIAVKAGVYTQSFVDPMTGELVSETVYISPEYLRQSAWSTMQMMKRNLDVPVCADHQDSAIPRKRRPVGQWLKEEMYGAVGLLREVKYNPASESHEYLFEVNDPKIAEKIDNGTIKKVSPNFHNEFSPGDGTRWKNVVGHLALTFRPVDYHQSNAPVEAVRSDGQRRFSVIARQNNHIMIVPMSALRYTDLRGMVRQDAKGKFIFKSLDYTFAFGTMSKFESWLKEKYRQTIKMSASGKQALLYFAVMHAPIGGVVINGKRYAGGQFIPTSSIDSLPAPDQARIKQSIADSDKKRAAYHAKFRNENETWHEALARHVGEHANADMSPADSAAAKRRMNSLRAHHGNAVMHRITALAGSEAKQLETLNPDSDKAMHLKRRLRAYHEMGKMLQPGDVPAATGMKSAASETAKIPELERHSGSWMVTDKKTGKVVEVHKLDRDKLNGLGNDHQIETAQQYLGRINSQIAGKTNPSIPATGVSGAATNAHYMTYSGRLSDKLAEIVRENHGQPIPEGILTPARIKARYDIGVTPEDAAAEIYHDLAKPRLEDKNAALRRSPGEQLKSAVEASKAAVDRNKHASALSEMADAAGDVEAGKKAAHEKSVLFKTQSAHEYKNLPPHIQERVTKMAKAIDDNPNMDNMEHELALSEIAEEIHDAYDYGGTTTAEDDKPEEPTDWVKELAGMTRKQIRDKHYAMTKDLKPKAVEPEPAKVAGKKKAAAKQSDWDRATEENDMKQRAGRPAREQWENKTGPYVPPKPGYIHEEDTEGNIRGIANMPDGSVVKGRWREKKFHDQDGDEALHNKLKSDLMSQVDIEHNRNEPSARDAADADDSSKKLKDKRAAMADVLYPQNKNTIAEYDEASGYTRKYRIQKGNDGHKIVYDRVDPDSGKVIDTNDYYTAKNEAGARTQLDQHLFDLHRSGHGEAIRINDEDLKDKHESRKKSHAEGEAKAEKEAEDKRQADNAKMQANMTAREELRKQVATTKHKREKHFTTDAEGKPIGEVTGVRHGNFLVHRPWFDDEGGKATSGSRKRHNDKGFTVTHIPSGKAAALGLSSQNEGLERAHLLESRGDWGKKDLDQATLEHGARVSRHHNSGDYAAAMATPDIKGEKLAQDEARLAAERVKIAKSHGIDSDEHAAAGDAWNKAAMDWHASLSDDDKEKFFQHLKKSGALTDIKYTKARKAPKGSTHDMLHEAFRTATGNYRQHRNEQKKADQYRDKPFSESEHYKKHVIHGPKQMGVVHAPKGGSDAQGHHYAGGQFTPQDANATGANTEAHASAPAQQEKEHFHRRSASHAKTLGLKPQAVDIKGVGKVNNTLVHGQLAIHPNGQGQWRVTHMPTGKRVGQDTHRDAAVHKAYLLHHGLDWNFTGDADAKHAARFQDVSRGVQPRDLKAEHLQAGGALPSQKIDPAAAALNWMKHEPHYLQAKGKYIAKNGTFDANGNLMSIPLNVDDWREHIPGYTGTNAHENHAAASYANERLMSEMLEQMKGKGNGKVVILGGGSGSGKGTSVGKHFDERQYPIRLDQTSSDYDKLVDKIRSLKQHGYQPDIVFVDRPPHQAWQGVVHRAMKSHEKGEPPRTVPPKVAVHSNIEARKVALRMAKENPDIPLRVIDAHAGDPDKSRLLENPQDIIGHLEPQQYDINEELDKAHKHVDELAGKGHVPGHIAKALKQPVDW